MSSTESRSGVSSNLAAVYSCFSCAVKTSLITEPPLVATGRRQEAALNSSMLVLRPAQGRRYPRRRRTRRNRPRRVQAPQVRRPERADLPEPETDRGPRPEGQEEPGDRRRPHAQGELALGRDVVAAFMTWDGYNFEDAILVSEKPPGRTTGSRVSISMSSTLRSARRSSAARSSPATSRTSPSVSFATSTTSASSASVPASVPATSSLARSPPSRRPSSRRKRSSCTPSSAGPAKREERFAGRAGRHRGIVIGTQKFSRRMSLTEDERKTFELC